MFAPKAKSSGKKRKAKGSQKPRKRQRIDSDSDSDSSADDDYDDEETSDEPDSADDTRDPLTEEQISNKISEIKANKKKARQERAEVEGKIKTLDPEIKALQVCLSATECPTSEKSNADSVTGQRDEDRSRYCRQVHSWKKPVFKGGDTARLRSWNQGTRSRDRSRRR